MYCPECRGEYREGFTVCDDCGVDLVAELPAEEEKDHDVELVEVFETSEPDVIPVIKSVLDGAEIPYFIEGEAMVELFPAEFLGSFYDPRAKVKFKVDSEHVEEARELLAAHLEAVADDAVGGHDD